MEVGEFNLYKIKLNLDLLHSKEDKLIYLYGMKKDLNRVIRCLSSNKLLGLRNYARDDIILEDSCPELMQLLKKILMKYGANSRDHRYPGEDILKREILDEIKSYNRFDELIDLEIEQVKSDHRKITEFSST
jgi:hypothetical protein